MWITGKVDLPREVIDAHREGRLVLFVGAGASFDHPSNLQTFDDLAADVAKKLGATEEVLERFRTRPDALLGYLATRDPQPGRWPVHELVREILADPASKPNANHEAIMRIAAASPVMRVVTTNFDDHLASHAGAALMSIPNVYVGPALPLGRDFRGLVHLHGSVLRSASEFVLTDADFGAAYLTESWAARFLYSMFSSYVVLFIGYSHQDVVMNYLARGLPESQTRYALTSDPDGAEWRPLNIKAIGYPTVSSSHAALTEALSAWADLTEMGALAHRSRIREIVSAPPTADRAELDYLADTIAKGYGARAFEEFASHAEWLGWLSESEVFEPNLTTAPPTEASAILARWFAERATESDENTTVALEILRTKRTLSQQLWVDVAHCVSRLSESTPERFETWVSVLLSYPVDEFAIHDYLSILLSACEMPAHKNAALALWRATLTPRVELRTPMFGFALDEEDPTPRRPNAEIVWSIDQYWANETWESKLRPNLSVIAHELLTITQDKLRAAYRLLAGYNGGKLRFDSTSFRRSAIEAHEQDARRDIEDTVIDVLRDCLDHYIVNAPNRAEGLIDSWLEDPLLIFQRLALYGITRAQRPADESIDLLVDRDLLFRQGLRYEVFQLLRASAPNASRGSQDRLLTEIRTAELDPKHGDYIRYNILVWLTDSNPDWSEAKDYLASLQGANPRFSPRPNPELVSSMSSGFRAYTPPLTDEDLTQKLSDDPAGALSALLTYDYGDSWTDGPRWEDAFEQVTRFVAASPARGLTIWDTVQTFPPDPRLGELSNAIVRGWSREALPGNLWSDILARIDSYNNIQELEYYLAELLLAGVSNQEHGMPDEELAAAVELADRLWSTAAAEDQSQTSEEWMSAGLNSSVGELTQFLVRVVSRARVRAGEEWTGLDDQMAARFSRILDDDRDSLGGPRAVLGSELRFLFHADEEFCVTKIFPLMSGTQGAKPALQVWSGYLYSARIDLRMLERGFADVVLSFRSQVALISNELRTQYYTLVGLIAGAPSPLATTPVDYAKQFLVPEYPDQIEGFLNAIELLLDQQDPDEVQKTWDAWLGEFMRHLSTGAPVALTKEQWSAAVGWVPHLGTRFPAAVELILKRPASLNTHAQVLHDLADTTIPETYPESCRDLLAHLLLNIESPFWGTHYLGPVALRLKASLGKDGVKDIVERAMAAGIYDAATWAES